MIRPLDAFVLARTKLRTHRVRTGITVGVSGVLFGLMMAISMLVAGVEDSAQRFSEEGLGARFILMANAMGDTMTATNEALDDPQVRARAEAIHIQLVADKKAEAKRLGLAYDERGDVRPVVKHESGDYLELGSPAAKQAVQEYLAQRPQRSSFDIIQGALAPYRPIQYYQSQRMAVDRSNFKEMPHGKEVFDTTTAKSSPVASDPFAQPEDAANAGVLVMDDVLVRPFLLEKTSWQPSSGTVPVVVTYVAAERMLGMKPLGADATNETRLARIQDIRARIGGHQTSYCYRNAKSQEAITQTITQSAELLKRQAEKDYQKPSQLYTLPDPSACGPAVVKADTRSAEEKRYAANQERFDRKFGLWQEPVQTKVTFQVVGLSPGYGTAARGMLSDIAMSVLGSSLGNEWVVPRGMYMQLPAPARHEATLLQSEADVSPMEMAFGGPAYYAEFADFTSARAAVKKYSCIVSSCDGLDVVVMQFGGSSVTLAEIKDGMRQALLIGVGVVAGIAVIIMWGTIGRTIADSRRETAVFRSIGAKRSDISLIYLAYTILLSLRIVAFAVILGVSVAVMVDYFSAPDASIGAQLMFGASDTSLRFGFFGLRLSELLAIAGLVLMTGLVSMTLPLLRNVRRNPIGDMRDE